MKTRGMIAAVAMGLLGASPAWAHPGHPATDLGWAAGLAHPWMGADHLLVIAAIGFLAVRLGGKAMWMLPLAFVSAMALGLAMPAWGVANGLELGVAASVFLCGLMLWLESRQLLVALLLAVVFGWLHGHVHSSESLAAMGSVSAGFTAGVLTSTALLHGLGMMSAGLVRGVRLDWQVRLVRVAGTAVTLAGAWLLVH